jgi:hypothetical protein
MYGVAVSIACQTVCFALVSASSRRPGGQAGMGGGVGKSRKPCHVSFSNWMATNGQQNVLRASGEVANIRLHAVEERDSGHGTVPGSCASNLRGEE